MDKKHSIGIFFFWENMHPTLSAVFAEKNVFCYCFSSLKLISISAQNGFSKVNNLSLGSTVTEKMASHQLVQLPAGKWV